MKALKHYADKRFSNLARLLKNFDSKKTPVETLHKVRIEVKKIKSLLQLIKFCVHKFKAHKYFIPFRTIFRTAGVIRQAEVFLNLMRTYHLESHILSAVPENGSGGQHASTSPAQISRHIAGLKKARKKLTGYLERIRKKCLRKCLKKKREELKSRLYPRPRLPLLHKTRKIIKEIVYLDQAGKISPSGPDTFYKETESLIGQWHDKKMLILLLKKYRNAGEVNRLAVECRADIKNLKKKIALFYYRKQQAN